MKAAKIDFATNLIYYRQLRGYTQSVLAGICGCGKATIGGLESRKTNPSFDLILKIADALEIHPGDLFIRNASKSKKLISIFLRKTLPEQIRNYADKEFPE